MDPEFFFGPDHLVRGEFPYIDRAGNRVSCLRVPRREEMLLEPVNKTGAEGNKTPALLAGKRIEDKQCRIFSGGFRFYCCGL